jgi:hypothetical protein
MSLPLYPFPYLLPFALALKERWQDYQHALVSITTLLLLHVIRVQNNCVNSMWYQIQDGLNIRMHKHLLNYNFVDVLGSGKSSWPELVGVNEEAAAATIVRENPKVAGTVIVKGGMMVKHGLS